MLIQIMDHVNGARVLLGNIEVWAGPCFHVTTTLTDGRGETTETAAPDEDALFDAIERGRATIAAASD